MLKDIVEMRQLWIQVNEGPEAIGMSQTWPPTESPFPFNDNLTTLMLIVASDLSEVQRETSRLSVLKVNNTAYTLDAEQTVFVELFCRPKSSMENPSLSCERTRRQYTQSDQGFFDNEKSCFWTWDDNVYAWQSTKNSGPPN